MSPVPNEGIGSFGSTESDEMHVECLLFFNLRTVGIENFNAYSVNHMCRKWFLHSITNFAKLYGIKDRHFQKK